MDLTVFRIANPNITAGEVKSYEKMANDEEFIENLKENLNDKDTRDFLFKILFYGCGVNLVNETVFKNGEDDAITDNMIRDAATDPFIDCKLDATFYYLSIVFIIKAKKDIYTQLGSDTDLATVADETYTAYLEQKRTAIEKEHPKRYLLTILKNERIRMMSQEGSPLGVLYKAGSKNREKFKAAMKAGQSEDVSEANRIFQEISTDNRASNFALQQVYHQARATVNLDAKVKTKDNESVTISEAIADTRDPGYSSVEDEILKQELLEMLPCPIMRLIVDATYMNTDSDSLVKKNAQERAKNELYKLYGIDNNLYSETLRHAEDILSFKLDPLCEKAYNRRKVKKPVDLKEYEERKKIFTV